MNDNQSEQKHTSNNPWKIGVIATAGAVALLVAAGFTFAAFNSSEIPNVETAVATQSKPPVQVARIESPAVAPAPRARENCDQYLVAAQRDATRVAKEGAIGAVIGAGTGAAGGAIADGGSGAGKGAGIGAVLGAVAGAAHGYTQESDRVSSSQQAYQDCLARNR
jgi:uncharacterized protein YcfJ